MGMMFHASRFPPLALVWLAWTAGATNQMTNVSGYLIDLYCFGLAQGGQLAFDGTDVLRAPWTHTLKCLRVPQQCRDGGFYVAGKQQNGEYGILFTFDGTGNAKALALLDADTRNDAADGNFLVTAVGVHQGDGVLRGADISLCTGGAERCDSVCMGNCRAATTKFELKPSGMLVAHVVFMMLGWGFLLPLGVIWARGLRRSKHELHGKPLWFAGHRIIQSLGWFFQLIGFGCIIAAKEDGGGDLAVHFGHRHEVLGLIVVILGSLQPLNAQLRHLSFIGHASEDGMRTRARMAWEWLHKGQGYVAVLLAMINIILGIVYANDLSFGDGLVPGTIIGAAISLGGLLALAVVLEARRLFMLGPTQGKGNKAEDGQRNKQEAGAVIGQPGAAAEHPVV